MEQITISEFRATCHAIIERVRRSGKPILVTRFGEPVFAVAPVQDRATSKRWVGSLASTGKVLGDIVSPASNEDDGK